MNNNKVVNITLVSAAVSLGLFSTNAFAAVDILDIKLQGQSCEMGFSPIAADEVMPIKSDLVGQMGPWQITNLADGYVLMGSGYNGTIKQDRLAATTWCTYNTPPDHSIPNYAPLLLPENDEANTEWRLVNKQEFYKPLALLAHYLGFGWAGGTDSQYVGDDMLTSTDGLGNYDIDADSSGSCEGYRCNERLKMDISGFQYHIDPETFSAGQITQSDKELIGRRSEVVTNESDLEQQYRVTFKYDKSTNWSKTDTYGLSQKVSTKNKFKWPLVGETELSIEIGASQSWATTNGNSDTKGISNTIVVNVAPNTKQEVFMEVFRSSISYPYSFNAQLSYELALTGFMRWSGNALSYHPEDRPTYTANWVIGRNGGNENNLKYQYEHRNIPATSNEWDWPWLLRQYGENNVKNLLGEVLRPIQTHITGEFFADSSFGSDVRFGKTIPLDGRTKRSTDYSLTDQELEAYGIKNFTVEVVPVPKL
ncbi:aerolysin family beta-barrel pore-forming toxin [Vibrio galatheae]|nr:aerolysin family beta-barrel pore-forming toxin [Vibrio galatheae]